MVGLPKTFSAAAYRHETGGSSKSRTPTSALMHITRFPAAIGSPSAPIATGAEHANPAGLADVGLRRQQRRLSLLSVVFGLIGLGLAIASHEIEAAAGGRPTRAATWVKGGVSVSTVALLVSVYAYYSAAHERMRVKHLVPPCSSVLTSPLALWAAAELALCAVHSGPFLDLGFVTAVDYDVTRDADDSNIRVRLPILIVMFGRLYLVPRALRDRSFLFSRGARFVGSLSNLNFSNWLVLKTILDAHPYLVVSCLFGTFMASLSYIVHAAERVDNPQHSSILDSLWFVSVATTTLGLGDIIVTTFIGRLSAFVAALLGLLLTALLVALVQHRLALSLQEAKVVTFLRRDRSRRMVAPSAAIVIQRAWRWHRLASRPASARSLVSSFKLRVAHLSLYKALRAWRLLKRTISTSAVNRETDMAAVFDEIFLELLDTHADIVYLLDRVYAGAGTHVTPQRSARGRASSTARSPPSVVNGAAIVSSNTSDSSDLDDNSGSGSGSGSGGTGLYALDDRRGAGSARPLSGKGHSRSEQNLRARRVGQQHHPVGAASLANWSRDMAFEKSAAVSRLQFEVSREAEVLRQMSFNSLQKVDKTSLERRQHLLRRLDPSASLDTGLMGGRAGDRAHRSASRSGRSASRSPPRRPNDVAQLRAHVAALEDKVDAQFSTINAALAILLERGSTSPTADPADEVVRRPAPRRNRGSGRRSKARHPPQPSAASALPQAAAPLGGLTPISPPLSSGRQANHTQS